MNLIGILSDFTDKQKVEHTCKMKSYKVLKIKM